MIEENAKKLLYDVADVLESAGLPYFLASGTCLGAIREGKFIEYDKDIDLDCLWEDFITKVDQIAWGFKRSGIRYEIIDHRHRAEWDGSPYSIKFAKYGEHGDLSSFKRQGPERTCPSHASTHWVIYPACVLEELDDIEFYGRTFKVPRFSNQYLGITYGDWKTPNPKDDGMQGTCIVSNYGGV